MPFLLVARDHKSPFKELDWVLEPKGVVAVLNIIIL
jgi:hypothetical protein